jgi:hypothetical protein
MTFESSLNTTFITPEGVFLTRVNFNLGASGGLLGCENGGSMDLRNVGILPQHHTASQHRRPRLESYWP